MRTVPIWKTWLVIGLGATAIVACGSDDAAVDTPPSSGDVPQVDVPQIVVTTNIIGDIVTQAIGDVATVEVIMPPGASPHEFQASARQAASMEKADLLIVNGAGFEEGMIDIIDAVTASGTDTFVFADAVDLLTLDELHHPHDHDDGDHDEVDHDDADHDDADHDDADHDDADHDDADHDEAGAPDPHIWTDPQRMRTAVVALEAVLADLDGIDAATLTDNVDRYLVELDTLTDDMEQMLAAVPTDRRILVTNHEVFGYFADRFDFRVAGAIIPSLSTSAEATAAGLDELTELIEAESVPAIFVETTQSTRLADAIADESDQRVDVVQLFSESLGGPGSGAETYLSMMRSNAQLVADALSS